MKRKLTKILASFLCVAMIITAAPLSGFVGMDFSWLTDLFSIKASAETTTYSGTCGDNLTWTLDTETGVLDITGTGDMTDWSSSSKAPWYSSRSYITSITIPDSVTSIGNSAFYNCYRLTSITIGNSVTSIGNYAFYYCYSLTSVTIPDSVASIGNYAFESCDSLTSITIGNSVTSIGSYAFLYCDSLTSVTIGNSVTSIGYYAFCYCDSLTSVTIGNSVTSIGYYAFAHCDSLTSITIPDSVTSIGHSAFYNTGYYNNDSNWTDGVLYIGNHLIEAKTSISGAYTIKHGTKIIDDSAFEDCSGLTSITIPDSVTSIGSDAFEDCSGLTSITIPDSVTSIGNFAFHNCDSLTSITIPDSVTSIGDGAFAYCDSLTSITIPDSVTSIGYHAFYNTGHYNNDSNWTDGVLYIGNHLIEAKTSISGTYTIKHGTKIIDDSAFNGRGSLTSITIPDSVTSIGNFAFYNCDSLTSITIPDSVTSIGDGAFAYCDSLTSVTIGNSVTSIGSDAFASCDSLTSVTIPDSVTSIGDGAFAYCDSLTSITIPDSVTSIGDEAFVFCYSLTSVTIGNSVTSIGYDAFAYCDSLTSVTIPDSVTSIGYYAFAYCDSLTSVTIPDSVTSIGSRAFYSCDSLTDVYYGGSEEEWKKISSGSSLTNATIHYNSIGSDDPTTPGDDDIPTDRTAHTGILNDYKTTGQGMGEKVSEVIIDNTSYPVNKDTVDYYLLDSYLNKEVVFVIKNDEVVFLKEIPDISERISFAISTVDVLGYSFYGDNKFSRDSVKLKINIYNISQTNTISPPGKDGDEYEKNLAALKSLDCLNINPVEVQLSSNSDVFNFNGKNSVNIPIKKVLRTGESFETEFVVNLNEDVDLDSYITGADFTGALTCDLNGCYYVEFDDCYVKITNYNLEPHLPSVSGGSGNQGGTSGGSTTNRDQLARKAANELKKVQKNSSNGAVSLAGSADLIELIGLDKLDAIGAKILSVMVLSTAPQEKLKNTDVLSDAVIEKLFGAKKWFQFWNNKVSFDVVVDTDKYGEIKICFTSENSVYNFNGGNLGSLGQINYEITGGKGKKSLEKSGFPMEGFAGAFTTYDLDSFSDAVFSFVLDELKKSYDLAYGNNLDKAADFIFGESVNRILSYTDFGSVSGVYWEMITFPGKSFKIECPVNIYVYDVDDNLVASIENNKITLSNEDIYMEINGDTKYIKLPNDSYKIVYAATAKGKLRVTVDEMANDSTSLRTIIIDAIPLVAGAIYTQDSTGKIAEDADYSLIDNNGTTYVADYDELNFHAHSSNGVYLDCSDATCQEYGLKCSLCTVCKEWYYIQKEKTSHTDANHDNYCDICNESISVSSSGKVNKVTINDFTVLYKDPYKLVPKIEADEGVEYTVTYTSSDNDVVTVDKDGNITTKDRGTATITVTVTDEFGNEVKDTCNVEVKLKWWQWLIWIFLWGWAWY